MGAGRRAHLVEDHGDVPALAGRLTLDVEEQGAVGDRLEDDNELGRELQRQHRSFAGRQLD
jgi:hypothetical protein